MSLQHPKGKLRDVRCDRSAVWGDLDLVEMSPDTRGSCLMHAFDSALACVPAGVHCIAPRFYGWVSGGIRGLQAAQKLTAPGLHPSAFAEAVLCWQAGQAGGVAVPFLRQEAEHQEGG